MIRNVLAIETSCDETAVAVVEEGRLIRSNVISSQLQQHQPFGGVVPELAARCHLESYLPVLRQALEEAECGPDEIDLIAATYGPGLIGGLLVGLTAAKGLALAWGKPFIGVNHIEGHIYANLLAHPEIKPPLICLTVSGGHTDLLYWSAFGEHQVLGRTRDDAAGEAFDKVARVMGLGYPGGPAIDALARMGQANVPLVRGDGLSQTYDFSFSGLKTAVINLLHRGGKSFIPPAPEDLAASFQTAVIDQLADRTFRAVKAFQVRTVLLSGGVAANTALRQRFLNEGNKVGAAVFYPPPVLCTDNAAMIATAGFYRFQSNGPSNLDLPAVPNLSLG